MSRVDVIIPCYGYGHFLRECVWSVLMQDEVKVRVLILDDASPDNTAAVAAELAAGDCRVTVRRHVVNRGYVASYNEGLDWVDGDYAVMLDADDVLTPGALARAARLLDEHPEVGLVCGAAILTREPASHYLPPPHRYRRRIVSPAAWVEAFCTSGNNPVPTPTAVVRMSLVRKLGYRVNLPHAGDMEMWLRLGVHAPVGIIGAVQAFYRQHHANMNLRYVGLPDLRDRKAVFDTVFAAHGDRIGDRDRLFRLAYQGLREGALIEARRACNASEARPFWELLAFAKEVWPELALDRVKRWRRPRWQRWLRPRVRRLLTPLLAQRYPENWYAYLPRRVVPLPLGDPECEA